MENTFTKCQGSFENNPTICTTQKISLFLHGEFELDPGWRQSWFCIVSNQGEVHRRRADGLGFLDDGAIVVNLKEANGLGMRFGNLTQSSKEELVHGCVKFLPLCLAVA